VTDAAIDRDSGDADVLSLRFLVHSGSPRASLSRWQGWNAKQIAALIL